MHLCAMTAAFRFGREICSEMMIKDFVKRGRSVLEILWKFVEFK